MQNIAILIPDEDHLDSEEGEDSAYIKVKFAKSNLGLGWNLQVDLETLMNQLKEFHPSLQGVCRYVRPPCVHRT